MSHPAQDPTTISNIGVAMFAIADQDAAIAYYTRTLGWELRADAPYGDESGNRWVEVAPPDSATRLAGGASTRRLGSTASAAGTSERKARASRMNVRPAISAISSTE